MIETKLMVPENLCVKGIIESKKSNGMGLFPARPLSPPMWVELAIERAFFFFRAT